MRNVRGMKPKEMGFSSKFKQTERNTKKCLKISRTNSLKGETST